MTDQLDVHLVVGGITRLVGHAWFRQRRREPVSTVFEYSGDYLATNAPRPIDPNLPLVSGSQYTERLPGAFADCSPDRWGRNLIAKRRSAVDSERHHGELNDVDYLVGVSDLTRQGALRFAEPGEPTFLHPHNAVPKLIELPQLLHAADQVTDDGDAFDALKTLLDSGSGSLGGARPKASVRADDGRLAIAKFPHRDDQWDVMGWESVALDLADAAGIPTARRRLLSMDDGRHVLVLDRFDRTSDHQRVHYISAMTLLEAVDGDWHDYAEVADQIIDVSADAKDDLADLYRRVAFSVAIHNTDDHLRNLGFLWASGGWRLAPGFDINPNPNQGTQRVTGVAGATHRDDEPSGLTELAGVCRLTTDNTSAIHRDINTAIRDWRAVAARRQIPLRQIDQFEAAFQPLSA